MAEERILIIKLKQKPCDTCNVIRGCAGSCILESKWYSSMTCLDAIERIAEALCRKDSGIKSCHECIHNGTANCGYTLNEWFSETAEAALNALLED